MTTREELAGDCHGRVDERRSPIDDDATYVLNDDAHPRRHLPASDGPSDEIHLNCGDEGCLAKSDSFIALIESGMFLGECIRRSLQSAFPLPVITYSSVSELEHQHRPVAVRLIVLSLHEVGKEASLNTLKLLTESFPGIPIIVLAYKNDSELARTAICYGAKGYIPFTMEFGLAVEAVRFVLAGGTYVPVDCLDWPRVVAARLATSPGAVTNRELAVVRAIQQGKSNKVIAYDMNLCESTVKVHVRNIMQKLKAKNRTDVAIKCSAARF